MKLPIKKEFFDKIKSGEKKFEYRDAHITFVCEETGETLRREIIGAFRIGKDSLPNELKKRSDLFEDDMLVGFELKKRNFREKV